VAFASGILDECSDALTDISSAHREIGIFDEALLREASLATVKAPASTIRPLQVLAACDLHPDLFVMVMQVLKILRVWPEEWAERLSVFAY
jgi:hypothetical protein